MQYNAVRCLILNFKLFQESNFSQTYLFSYFAWNNLGIYFQHYSEVKFNNSLNKGDFVKRKLSLLRVTIVPQKYTLYEFNKILRISFCIVQQ